MSLIGEMHDLAIIRGQVVSCESMHGPIQALHMHIAIATDTIANNITLILQLAL